MVAILEGAVTEYTAYAVLIIGLIVMIAFGVRE